MWLIIPKNEASDIREWGLNSDLRNFAGIPDESSPNNLKRTEYTNTDIGYSSFSRDKDKIQIWVLDPRSRNPSLSPPRIPTELAKAVTKVFVHFGGTDFGDMSVTWIKEQWRNTMASLTLPELPNAEVEPISGLGHLPWRQHIAEFQEAFSSGKPFTVEPLQAAWSSAFQHFNALAPSRSVVEALFPFYIDASNYSSLPSGEKLFWSRDLERALQAAKAAIESLTSSPELDRVTVAKLKSALDGVLPKAFPPSDIELAAFISSYRNLSKEYTEMVLKANAAPPTVASAATPP